MVKCVPFGLQTYQLNVSLKSNNFERVSSGGGGGQV